MPARLFDPTLFRGQGALMTLGAMAGPHIEANPNANIDMFDFGDKALSVFLRWQVYPEIGLPSEPFKVWRRPATPLGEETKLFTRTYQVPPLGTVVMFEEPVVSFTAQIKAGSSAQKIIVVPLADGVSWQSALAALDYDLAANASRVLTFQAPYITGCLLIGTTRFEAIHGLRMSELSASEDTIGNWELVETVGLPVVEDDWSDLAGQTHGVKQGLVGSEVAAPDAAAQRFSRGVNPYGWHPLYPSGEAAPQWQFSPAMSLVEDAHKDVLPMLHDAMALPPEDQAAFTRNFTINPPQNPNGSMMDADDGTAVVSPLALLQLAVSTDPLQAVALGFGTGYVYEDVPPIHFGAISLFDDPDVSDWDYMVTGLWAGGPDGNGRPLEYAALIPRPRKVVPPPPAADLKQDFLAHQQPAAPDAPWVASARLSWERFVLDNITSVASFAVARHNPAEGDPATALLEKRPSGIGHLPIGNTRNPEDPERTRQSATDGHFPIPNMPGAVSAKYGIATQNIFGVWSPWQTVDFSTSQPGPDLVQIVDADLVPTDTGAGTICTGRLTVEFVLDWRVRRISRVDFGGRLFASATRHQDPPPGVPVGVQRSLGGPPVGTVITFSGDTPSSAAGPVQCLDAQGGNIVSPGAAQQGESRRYRFIIDGFSLDYATTPHIGLALRARLRERIAPNRVSAWSPQPKLAYASDPRARPTPPLPVVPLTSLPDASGECHAKLAWQAAPSAQGYILYQSNESAILTARGLPHPVPGTSLSQRFADLKAAFNAGPDRNIFTRVRDDLLTVTSLDVVLPRGSQVIHVWAVIPVSHGGVEGPWPSGPAAADQLIAYAAPKVGDPAPPTLEVLRVPDGAGFAARLRVETRGSSGARPRRIDLYRTRVADAARAVDSMGLPIAQVSATGGAWTVSEDGTAPDTWIDTLRGTDAPAGSWKYTWYRAVAWSDDDLPRGVRRGRSRPSPAVPVVIPPSGPPSLGPMVASWPGGSPGDVVFAFTAPVPTETTPLGDHRFQVDVTETDVTDPLLSDTLDVAKVDTVMPPTGTGLWRLDDGQDRNYRLIIRRNSVDAAASVTMRLTDPIGRTSERNARIEPGPILPMPVLSPIDAFSISGRGKVYSITIDDAPDEAFGGEFYRLRIALTPLQGGRPTLDPRFTIGRPAIPGAGGGRPSLPSRITPRPGPVLDLGLERRGSLFVEKGGLLVFERALKDIPSRENAETFSVVRQRIGDRLTVTVMARSKIRRIEFEVTLPDGRTVSRAGRG